MEVAKHTKKEAIIALCVIPLWLIMVLVIHPLVVNVFYVGRGFTFNQWRITMGLIQFTIPALIFVFIIYKKQGFASIGLHKERLFSALRLGFLFGLIPLFFALLPGFLYGGEFVGFWLFMFNIFTVFLFAAVEDISFIGFLQTGCMALSNRIKPPFVLLRHYFRFCMYPISYEPGKPRTYCGLL